MMVSPDSVSDTDAAGANISQHRIDAYLVDDAHAFAGKTQLHKTLLGLNPETVSVKVWQKAATCVVFGVGNIVS